MDIFAPVAVEAARWIHIDASLRILWNIFGATALGLFVILASLAATVVFRRLTAKPAAKAKEPKP